MREIKMKDVTLNCGATGEKLDRSFRLLKLISGAEPKKVASTKRIPGFNVNPGLEVGCKVTLKGKKAEELLKRLFESINFKLDEKKFGNGTLNFGIEEYLTISGLQFQRDIGILGFSIAIRLTRAGLTIDERKIKRGRIPKRHKITKEETMDFFRKKFNIEIKEKRKKEKI